MCTLIVATRLWREAPLVIAANRDEALARPSLGPRLAVERGMPILAPRDLEAGGTWLGLNARGVFAAITNRHNGVRHPDARSRGQLVLDALVEPSVEAAARRIAASDPQAHNPFHLVIADRGRVDLVWNDGAVVHHESLPPGIHVVTERSFDAAPTDRISLLEAQLGALSTDAPPTIDAWRGLLGAHRDEKPLEGVCVHAPALAYGTRSSTIVVLGAPPGADAFLHADGPPCTVPHEDRTSLLRSLLDGV